METTYKIPERKVIDGIIHRTVPKLDEPRSFTEERSLVEAFEGDTLNRVVNEGLLVEIFCGSCGDTAWDIEEHYLCKSCRNS